MKSASTAVPRPVFSTLHLFTETDNCQSVAQSAIKSRTVCSFDISRPFFIIKSVNSNRLTPFGLLYNVFLQLTRFRPTQRVCSSRASLIPVTHVISQQCPDAASVRFDPSVRKPIYDVFFIRKRVLTKRTKTTTTTNRYSQLFGGERPHRIRSCPPANKLSSREGGETICPRPQMAVRL